MRWKTLMGMLSLLGSISLAAGPGPAAASPAPTVEHTTLDGGLRLLVIPQRHLPMVVMQALVDAGSRLDPAGKEGVADLTAELLTEGTKSRTAAEIHQEADFLGARLGTSASDDYTTASMTALRRDLDKGVELLADVLENPVFPEEDFQREKNEALAAIESELQQPGAVAAREFRRQIYGDGPYRNPALGWKESVQTIRREDVVSFHERAYGPERTRIVVSGDVSLEDVEPLVRKFLGSWRRSGEEIPGVEPVEPPEPDVVRIDRDLSQTNLLWGHRGTTRDDPNWYAIQVMNHILGAGGFSSRLMTSIRTEAGLAYSVYSHFSGKKLPGALQVGLQTKNESTDEALRRLREEIERIRSDLVTEEELDEAKKYLIGSFPLRFDSNSDLVAFFSQVDFYGLGLDYPERYEDLIRSVTREDVLHVAKEYIHPKRASLVLVGRQWEIELR